MLAPGPKTWSNIRAEGNLSEICGCHRLMLHDTYACCLQYRVCNVQAPPARAPDMPAGSDSPDAAHGVSQRIALAPVSSELSSRSQFRPSLEQVARSLFGNFTGLPRLPGFLG
jgi:hypothetical protein